MQKLGYFKIERRQTMLKNNILTHKILPIISLTFFILFIFTINCFATDNNYYQESDIPKCFDIANEYLKDNNITYCNYVICYEVDTKNGGYAINLLFLTDPNASCFIAYSNTPRLRTTHTYLIQFNKQADFVIANFVNRNSAINTDWSLATDIKYSSCDINNYDNTIFFQKTPLLQGIQVVGITQMKEIPKVIIQIMKMIIPIGLVVLSIFLIIYLIRLVILRAM